MGQLANNKIDISKFKEVFEYQTYIYTVLGNETLKCSQCGDLFIKGVRITYLLTSQGMEHYHTKCINGMELISPDANI